MEHSEKLLRLVDKLSGTFRGSIRLTEQMSGSFGGVLTRHTEWKTQGLLKLQDTLNGKHRDY